MLVAGESSGHDDDHGPLGHRGVVLREAFVVAYGSAAAVDPGERACGYSGFRGRVRSMIDASAKARGAESEPLSVSR